jgi:hypothetical protein
MRRRRGEAAAEGGAPLDAAFAEYSGVARKFLFFLIVGVVLFTGSLWLERRRTLDG